MSIVSLAIDEEQNTYPDNTYYYSPSESYPEYLYSDVAAEKNAVYALVRNMFFTAGYDRDNYGKKEWNPLGQFIRPGQSIVIKPNWVHDINLKGAAKDDPYGMDCLVTHPSVIRAICDYCIIALKGQGTITICDAPIQDCNFDLLSQRAGIYVLGKFYSEHAQKVMIADLRKEIRITNRFAVKKDSIDRNEEHVYVTMNEKTAFRNMVGNNEFHVLNYDADVTQSFHKDGEHIYSISKRILDADVIINLCKPKCHRYAGITSALKNCIGMVTEKETLPHRRLGDSSKGGDSYLKKSWVKERIDAVLKRQIKHENAKRVLLATVCRFEYGFWLYISRLKGEDPSLKGCWHGNDTIWRTILDLNYIVRYADKNGIIQNAEQREIINIGDMIISGQHNGPLSPEPKKLGIMVCSEDAYAFDRTVCSIMGFDYHKVPLLESVNKNESWMKNEEIMIKSSINKYEGYLDNLKFPAEWKFRPHDAWLGFIEEEPG